MLLDLLHHHQAFSCGPSAAERLVALAGSGSAGCLIKAKGEGVTVADALVAYSGLTSGAAYLHLLTNQSTSRLGGFEVGGPKVYLRRGKQILVFDSVAEADAWQEAEEMAKQVIARASSVKRNAKKRIKAKAFKSAPEPQVIDLVYVQSLLLQLNLDYNLPALIEAEQWARVAEIAAQAMVIEDEHDIELLLLTL